MKYAKLSHQTHQMSRFISHSIGAIGLLFMISACTETAPKSEGDASPTIASSATPSVNSSVNPSASPSAMSSMKPMMDHGGMQGGMQGGMKGGMMNHAQMDLGPADADYDLRFIDGMIPHHEGALVMAKDALSKSQRPEIKTLANAILKAQPPEMAQMQQWRSAWYPKAPNTPMMWHSEMKHQMPMSVEHHKAMGMTMNLGSADAGYDLRFLDGMIPHHEAAVMMAKDALTKTKRPEMKKLAQAIVTSQQAEIDQMKQWHERWSKAQGK